MKWQSLAHVRWECKCQERPDKAGRLARRRAQVLAMQHHALPVEGAHDNRLVGGRLGRRRTADLVEDVEVLSRTNANCSACSAAFSRTAPPSELACSRLN